MACGGQLGRHRQPAWGRGSAGALQGSLQPVQLALTLSPGKSAPQLRLQAQAGDGPGSGCQGRTPSAFSLATLQQTLDEHLTEAQHTRLVLTPLQGLCSHDALSCHLASEMLLTITQDRSIKPEQVGCQRGLCAHRASSPRPPELWRQEVLRLLLAIGSGRQG